MHRTLVISSILFLALAAAAAAELQVSVTLTGDIDEILAVLARLRDMGVTDAQIPANDGQQTDAPIEMHSITVGSLDDAPAQDAASDGTADPQTDAAPEPAPDPAPLLALAAPTLTPGTAQPGDAIHIAVAVTDAKRRIDTLAVRVEAPDPIVTDLYDTGGQGDAIAGDGVWSRTVTLPPELPAGEYPIVVTAYDRDGAPLQAGASEDPEALLQTRAALSVEP